MARATQSPSTQRLLVPTVEQVPVPPRELAQRLAFGSSLRLIRTNVGLTQEELAHAAGLDRTYIGSVENGRRNLSLKAMWQLADALAVSPRAFFPVREDDGAARASKPSGA
ncbi:helix-turn-helix transcriptional regulator [Cellulomonas hominis]|nr:helix-turn-helix transcriptional regulator [Cellulomonas hominis]NKY05711.1 helix-turn-helix transcriptional regulator [Cellulomonas hominis]